MRWPIRNQILLPYVALQFVAVTAIALFSAWTAVRQVEKDTAQRLERVSSTLQNATYPLTPTVLNQLQQLSGAEFLAFDANDELLASTLQPKETPATLLELRPEQQTKSSIIENESILNVAGESYFAGHVERAGAMGGGSVLILYPVKSWELARQQAMSPPITIGSVLLLLTIVVSFWIARRIGARIQSVEQQVSRIADGDFDPVQIADVNDEMRDLAEAVNRMAVILDDSMQSIRERERSSLLTQLVGGLAHQFRNALTGARTSIQLHRRHCSTKDDEAIEVALRQLKLTEEQIKALLRLSRGESQASTPGSLGTVLEETVSLIRPICTHQKIDFSYEWENVDCSISDIDAIRAALLNLIMNAIEAAGPGGAIEVRATREDNAIAIRISDNGPGVPEELVDDVFTPFVTTKQEGVGLGLALARKAAEDVGGSLSLQRQDGMTTFCLELQRESGLTFTPVRLSEELRHVPE